MIYDGRNPAMAKCCNSIKYLVEKFSLISFTIKTNSRIHQQNPNKTGHMDLRPTHVDTEGTTKASGVVQFKY